MPRTPNIKRNQMIKKMSAEGKSYEKIRQFFRFKSRSTVQWIVKNGKTALDN